ncbi:MAG TPA: murein biosynthesis integral membrane protein MurJ [Acidimicrobiales bacterium]|nr:murein biosynthesis integral membrane protein MurJ [Acidimicrobiales bacterium]
MTGLEIEGPSPLPRGGRRLAGATAGMAVGTALSRATGLARVIAQTTALGGSGFADAYNLANTTPNIVTDIVIGGVLSATFVPVFVDHLATRPSREAWQAISAVVTATVALLVVATVAFFLLAPEIVRLYTVSNHNPDVAAQQRVATFLLRWFVPQLTCYGLIALFTALLNARSKFAVPMFVPVVNNLVVIVVLAWFHALVPHPTLASIAAHHRGLVLLGFGTTLGVILQTLLLVPSLLRAGLRLEFRWQPRHEAVRTITGLAGWTFGWVVANQVALFVVLALADPIAGAVSAYTYAYQFFLLPYGIVAVSLMTAVAPSLAARWARRDNLAFRRRMAFGLNGILAVVIPSAVGLVVLAHPLIDLVLYHGAESASAADATGAALAMFGLGLPGFCAYLYMVRVLQSMQDTKTAFRLYLVENGINVVLAVALVGPLGVRGLALSLSIAYTVAALAAMVVVQRRIGGLGLADLGPSLRRVALASAVMGVAAVFAVNASGSTTDAGLLLRIVLAVVVGVGVYFGMVVLLGARDERGHEDGGDDPAAPTGPVPPDRQLPPGSGTPPPRSPITGDDPPDAPGDADRPAGTDDPASQAAAAAPPLSVTGFRGRLHDRIGARRPRLRALPSQSDGPKEDSDGPNPGGDR